VIKANLPTIGLVRVYTFVRIVRSTYLYLGNTSIRLCSPTNVQPHAYGSLVLVASYAQLGRDEEARSALADIRALRASMMRWYLDRYSDPAAREHMADGLRKAGLLEQ